MKIFPSITRREKLEVVLILLIVLFMCWVPKGRTADVKYCENKVTGAVITVRANMPCPYPTAEL